MLIDLSWKDLTSSSKKRQYQCVLRKAVFGGQDDIDMGIYHESTGSGLPSYVQLLIDQITIESVAKTVVQFAMDDFHNHGLIIPGYDFELLRNGSGHIASLMFFGIAAYEPCGGSSSTRQFLGMLSELFEGC